MATILEDRDLIVNEPTGTRSIWPTAVQYGIIYAAAAFVLTLVFYNVGMMDLDDAGTPASFIPSVASYLALGVIAYLGVRAFREERDRPSLPTIRGIKWSAASGLIAGIVSLVLTYLFLAFMAPDYLDQMVSIQEVALEERGLSSSETEDMMEYMSMFTNPAVMSVFGGVGSFFSMFIAGSIMTLFLKTE